MHPPLGSRKPETRHLNLKWTVGDIDRICRMAKNGLTAVGICETLKGTSLESTPGEIVKLCFDAGQFVRTRVA